MKKFFARLGLWFLFLFLGNLIVIVVSGNTNAKAGFPIILLSILFAEISVRQIFPTKKDDDQDKE